MQRILIVGAGFAGMLRPCAPRACATSKASRPTLSRLSSLRRSRGW